MKRKIIIKFYAKQKRNPVAMQLCNSAYRKQVVQSKKVYSRKKKEHL